MPPSPGNGHGAPCKGTAAALATTFAASSQRLSATRSSLPPARGGLARAPAPAAAAAAARGLGHPLLRHEEESIPPYTILYDNPTWCCGLAVPERDYYTSSAGSGDVASTETPDPPPWWARN